MNKNLQNIQHKIQVSSISKESLYNGIPMMCTAYVHQSVYSAFERLKIDKINSRILVLGSGTGAFDQRLVDNGYKDVTSVEFIPENFTAKGTKLIPLDLNEDFQHLGKFDVIFAIELIEHLENQFHFIRNIKSCLEKKGVVYITSPNVESSFSRIKFFFLKRLHFFSVKDLYGTGHINPVFMHIFSYNIEKSNFTIANIFTNAGVWNQAFKIKSIKIRVVYFFLFLLSFLCVDKNDNDINIFEIIHLE